MRLVVEYWVISGTRFMVGAIGYSHKAVIYEVPPALLDFCFHLFHCARCHRLSAKSGLTHFLLSALHFNLLLIGKEYI